MKTRTEEVVDVAEWDKLVSETYGRPYNFQQQNGCQGRGTFALSVPSPETNDDEQNDAIPEVVNHETMGVKFAAWLAREPKQKLPPPHEEDYCRVLWWDRNFYPDIQTVANDLHSKGLLEAGDYIIIIDW